MDISRSRSIQKESAAICLIAPSDEAGCGADFSNFRLNQF
jgi:hypothetical protein